MKTLIKIRKDLYKKLVELSVEKFGHPRGISKIVNEILEKYLGKKTKNLDIDIKMRISEKIDFSPENLKKLRLEAWYESLEEELR